MEREAQSLGIQRIYQRSTGNGSARRVQNVRMKKKIQFSCTDTIKLRPKWLRDSKEERQRPARSHSMLVSEYYKPCFKCSIWRGKATPSDITYHTPPLQDQTHEPSSPSQVSKLPLIFGICSEDDRECAMILLLIPQHHRRYHDPLWTTLISSAPLLQIQRNIQVLRPTWKDFNVTILSTPGYRKMTTRGILFDMPLIKSVRPAMS